ncbi:SPFH domain-containing protein [Deinococcus sp.]|uniref:SPFH domain-containing protein n=1 Tax=Deinococcus sp. TaxID=47478 RepID=UPI002869A35E|nr:SPFH domain-containing protein [Deinococcus sp.]
MTTPSTSFFVPSPSRPSRVPVMLAAVVLAASVASVSSSIRHIEPTQIGMKISRLGSARGVARADVVSGYTLINPLATEVVTYPGTQVSYTWTKTATEESPTDESLNFNTADSVQMNVDVNFAFQIDRTRAPDIYRRFGPDVRYITQTYMRNVIRDQMTRVGSRFTSDEILGPKRAAFVDQVEQGIRGRLNPDGFTIQNFSVNQITPPDNIRQAINAKIEAAQTAIQAQNKVAQSRAEAEQEVAKARGDAQAILVRAQAQALANRVLAQSLTPQLVQSKVVEKWDGHQPQVVSDGGSLIQIPVTGEGKAAK